MIGELTAHEIDHLLANELVGRIGCYANGCVYVVPVNYVYDADTIYGHSGVGMKISMMREQPSVCFEVDRIDEIGSWRSVIAWGVYEELAGPKAQHALDLLVRQLTRAVATERSALRYHLSASSLRAAYVDQREAVVYGIRLTKRTGRFERP